MNFRRELSVVLAVLALCWIARYWLCSSFGLYEDDYWRVPPAIGRGLWEIPREFAREFAVFKQGRPLHGALIGLFAAAGARLHGISGMYWIGYCLSGLNALLLYALLRRAQAGYTVASVAAAALAVYPGDVSQAFLTHALGVQPSLAMVLAASHPWLWGRRLSAAAMAVKQAAIGPPVSLTSYLWRPWEMAPEFGRGEALAGVLGAMVVIFLLRGNFELPKPGRLGRLCAAGLALLALAYPLALTVSATEVAGRAARVHYAASAGCAVLLGCLFGRLSRLMRPSAAVWAFAALLGFSCAAGYAVQRDYARSWNYQRRFWSDVVRLCPDLHPDTVILLENAESAPRPRHLSVIGWHMPMVLPSIYHFQVPRGREPRLYVARPGWRKFQSAEGEVVTDGNTVRWPFDWEAPRRVKWADLILLRADGDRLVRKIPPRPPVRLTEGVLYPYLVGNF